MKYQVKFEWIFAVLILAGLYAIYFLTAEPDIKSQIAMALVSGFSAVIGFIFGKSKPEQ